MQMLMGVSEAVGPEIVQKKKKILLGREVIEENLDMLCQVKH